jgi:hypothetical protein
MGIAIARRAGDIEVRTVSLFLHDKASGGAGFSIQAFDLLPALLPEIDRILDCPVPACMNACPACVLAGDLSDDEAAILDRKPRSSGCGAAGKALPPVRGIRWMSTIIAGPA